MVIELDWHHTVIYFLKGKTHFNMALGQSNITIICLIEDASLTEDAPNLQP